MKKKLLLTVLPLLALVGCSSLNAGIPEAELDNTAEVEIAESNFVTYLDDEDGLPTIHRDGSSHKTYLMLSPFGSIEGYEGVSTKGKVSDKYYENTVVLEAAAGTALPDATQVKSSVTGATFRGWAYYNENNDHVWPDYYDKVPAENGLALKAIFDGTTSSGGGGSGGGGGGSEVVQTTWEAMDLPSWITDDGCVIFAWAWAAGSEGTWYSLTYTGTKAAQFTAPSNIVGMLLVRCAENTVTPDWSKTEGPGTVYNQTEDVNVVSGKYSYSFPSESWKEYHAG